MGQEVGPFETSFSPIQYPDFEKYVFNKEEVWNRPERHIIRLRRLVARQDRCMYLRRAKGLKVQQRARVNVGTHTAQEDAGSTVA